MEPEKTPGVVTDEKVTNVWNTVTPLSKYLATTLFVALPFIGGWIGYTFAPEKIIEVEKIVEINKPSHVRESQQMSESESVSKWDTRELTNYVATSTGVSFQYPEVWGPVEEYENNGIYTYHFSGISNSAYFLSVEPVDGIGNYQEGAVSWLNRVTDTAQHYAKKCNSSQNDFNFPDEKCFEFINSNGINFYDFYGYFFSYGDPGPHGSDYTHNFITNYNYNSQEYWVILSPQKIYMENFWTEKVFQSVVVDSLNFIDV